MIRAKGTALVLLTAVLAFGAPQQAKDWVKYNSDEGRYSVLFPYEPKLSTQEATASTGEKFTQYTASSHDLGASYMIGYFDVAGFTFSFDKARDGYVTAVKGTLLAERAISLGGYSGRELRVAAKDSDGNEFILLARYYQVEARVYVVHLVFPKSSENTIAERTTKFFDSFQVTKPR